VRRIQVAAGVISDSQGRILITKRPDDAHQGGLWEFPGGKLEPGESPSQALARELEEELGIRVTDSRPLIRLSHDYGDRHVLLIIRRVLAYSGAPRGREGQALDWVAPGAMDPARFPAADRPVITALRLPSRYLITGSVPATAESFVARLEQALDRTGVRAVQLRAPWLDDGRYAELAQRCAPICNRAGALLLLNCAPTLAMHLPGDGLHLSEPRLRALAARPQGDFRLVGASCHDAGSLATAETLGLDYALLSPVCPTASHPTAEPLGWHRFAELVEPASLPVYALGGLGQDALETAWEHGAQGVAGIRGFWNAESSAHA
jgi:8-oxo-dGTP diphosphatase